MSSKNKTKRIPDAATATLDGIDKLGFAMVGKSLLIAPAFKELKPSAKLLYVCMLRESGGADKFPFTRLTALHYGFTEATFRRSVTDLENNHFITHQSGRTTREANIFQFRYDWKLKTQ